MSASDAQRMSDLLQKASSLSAVSFKGKPKQTNQWTWAAGSSSFSCSSSPPALYLLPSQMLHCIEIYELFVRRIGAM